MDMAAEPTVYGAFHDDGIQAKVYGVFADSSNFFMTKHSIPRNVQAAYADLAMRRISSPHIISTVERVGRNTLRQLSRKEGLVGPAAGPAEIGKDCSALLGAIEMAFCFQNVDGDNESKILAEIMNTDTPEEIAIKVCGLSNTDKLYPDIVEIIRKVHSYSAERNDWRV
ncbi:mannitol-1-phosphate 5-dehydrogenase [Xylariales sp. PMI_506]|nr:mannitol-1-phosphate 5-dehydrogenase [Xylariales sp. PMI_506]